VSLIRFLLLTGARFGEAANSSWDQFDLERGIWTKPSSHTKQQRTHVVPFAAPARMLLGELRAQSTGKFLFPGPTGKPITTIKRFWVSVCRQAGLQDTRVHDLRHTVAAMLASSGASLPLIGALLGHTQPATTARYSHLIDSAQREAIERVGAMVAQPAIAEIVPLHRRR
jgi:integrase